MKLQISPFQFGTLATKENFIDRVEDRALLKQLLNSHVNTMLVSPRRWGKSSLVRMATSELCAEERDIRVCHIDAFSVNSEAEFYKLFASQVISCTSNKVERWIADAKRFLSGVVPQIVVNDQITDFLAFDLKFVPQEKDKISILQLPEVLAREKGYRIIVCIDEFQQLALLPEYQDMEGKMRSVWQQQQLVTYCIYGSKRNMMLRIFNNSNSPFYRFGQVIFMQKIKKEHWLPFITSSFQRTGKTIDEDFSSRICDIVECHSWYLQQLCFFVWTATVDAVTEEIFSRSLQQVIDVNTPMFQNDTENLTASQKQMLLAIANGETHLSSKDVKDTYHLGNPNTIARSKRILQEKDFIELDPNGQLYVSDPVFRRWIRSSAHSR